MEELAQSVGNKKMPAEFDWDSATDVNLNTDEAGPLRAQIPHRDVKRHCRYSFINRTASPWAEETISGSCRKAPTSSSQRSNPVFLHPADGYIGEEINKDSGYANVVPHCAETKR